MTKNLTFQAVNTKDTNTNSNTNTNVAILAQEGRHWSDSAGLQSGGGGGRPAESVTSQGCVTRRWRAEKPALLSPACVLLIQWIADCGALCMKYS